jgi:hypothetical protein
MKASRKAGKLIGKGKGKEEDEANKGNKKEEDKAKE